MNEPSPEAAPGGLPAARTLRKAKGLARAGRLLGAAALCLAASAAAHHGRGVFALDDIRELAGTVKRYDWRNPHVYLYLKADGAEAGSEDWVIEMHNVRSMSERGWAKDSLAAGERIALTYSPHRNPKRRLGFGNTLTLANGAMLHLRQLPQNQAALEDAQAASIDGIWQIVFSGRSSRAGGMGAGSRAGGMGAGSRAGGMGAPGMGMGGSMGMGASGPELAALREAFPNAIEEALAFVPNLTEQGRAALRRFDVDADDNPWCLPVTTPIVLRYPGPKQVRAEEDAIVFELSGIVRRAYLDGRPPPEGERSLHGHSLARWEGKTLVVETEHFAHHPWGHENGIPSSESKRVVERYEMAEDGKSMKVSYVMHDPEILARPMADERTWNYAPGLQIFLGADCDPEVARRFLTEG